MMYADGDAVQAVDNLRRRFDDVRTKLLPSHPDLHLVIVEAPAPGHPAMAEVPPIGKIRPQISGKALLSPPQSVMALMPSRRFLYYGDHRLLDAFQGLSNDAAELLRAYDPDLDRFIRQSTWEGPLYCMPNLWADAIWSIAVSYDFKAFMRRWRWSGSPDNLFVPFDNDEYLDWLQAEHQHGGKVWGEVSQDVNIIEFTSDVFTCSVKALEAIADFMKSVLDAAEEIDNATVNEQPFDEDCNQVSSKVLTSRVPVWDEDERTLTFGKLSRAFYRGSNQVTLLQAFQNAKWAESIRNPWPNDEDTLREACRGLSNTMKELGWPLEFKRVRIYAKWSIKVEH